MSDSNNNERLELTKENVLYLWSKTYNTDGKPDWSHIFKYYSDDIVFQDSIQRIEGIDGFIALCNRLTDRCKELKMDIESIVKEENIIIMDWKMTMMFKKYPSTPIFGSTKLVLNDEGKIAMQRDYYDLWGDIFNGIPWFKKPYRKFMGKKFG
ncbi:MAG: nuclear transport factor 2 family protein [Clostridia bacterium]|nr:nuclear transport factor 2 family protein [Clostridia bacterium]